jgi:NADPH-dependent curcumin reductase CurA
MVMLLIRQAKAEGFIITRFTERYPEGVQQLAQWVSEGKIKYREDIMEGLENAPAAFIRMLKGENKGKQLVKV